MNEDGTMGFSFIEGGVLIFPGSDFLKSINEYHRNVVHDSINVS